MKKFVCWASCWASLRSTQPTPNLRSLRGSSLIEVLVSLMLLSIFLLGMDAMQLTSLKKNKTNYYVAVAQQQLDIVAEQLAARLPVAMILDRWNAQNRLVLPQGAGKITGAWPHYQFAIAWGNYALNQCQENKPALSGCLHGET